MIRQTVMLNDREKIEIKENRNHTIDFMLLRRKGFRWRVIDSIRLDVSDETKVRDEADAALRESQMMRQRMLDDPVSFIEKMHEVDELSERLERLSEKMEQATIRLRNRVESAVAELVFRHIERMVM
ncbi:hypothetical protein DNHGIG_00560 [Collibacillus ludicampi]|uniref:Uncharacterized protein n=1 Tax=Collibacillus ludicampi TaxID=2771369 RepID=A0AAV4L9N6_9BACL|nr:hypothetical protein [Collibacillus ludicampi]GIM44507.1 hypothetical protein DNHGIG_00560 [Collibacillus ludicampi]